jgi:hypothetical protein
MDITNNSLQIHPWQASLVTKKHLFLAKVSLHYKGGVRVHVFCILAFQSDFWVSSGISATVTITVAARGAKILAIRALLPQKANFGFS